jgi:hypothetical protein
MSFIDTVRAKRRTLADVLSDDDYSGIRSIVEELYPDRAHFIYEVLQNAEDKDASSARFELHTDRLIFEHDGQPFSESDVWGITNIGKSTKSGQVDKIGRFGVGFKAVFAYSETPHVWSPTFSFKITQLVLPSELDHVSGLRKRTRFEFPFNNPKKDAATAHAEIGDGLKELDETTLLFLSHLTSIQWRIIGGGGGEVRRARRSEHHFEVHRQLGGKNITSHFLRFDRPVDELERQQISIAFDLDLLPGVNRVDPDKAFSKQLRVVPANPGRVAVFFPAEKETSGLRFHVHGPFVPELSRASIKDTPANEPLFGQVAALSAASLHQIRDLGLLTTDFLSVLPNQQDPLPQRYQGLRDAIVTEMNEQPLTPTHAKAFAPAAQLFQGKASLKELLSSDDLRYLANAESRSADWAMAAAQKNSNADRFLAGLAITEWDVKEFIDCLVDKASEGYRYSHSRSRFVTGPDEEFMTWLTGKTAEWHQRFYSLLYTELAATGQLHRLKQVRIVRLGDGSYAPSGRCFFPTEDVTQDSLLPRVDAGVYTSGRSKNQQDNARKCLEELGVRNVGEAEQVEAILKQRYTKDAAIPAATTYQKDLRQFIKLFENDPGKASLFAPFFIFERSDKKWSPPGAVFLDRPFLDTDLSAYYDVFGSKAERVTLAKEYQDRGVSVKRLVAFAQAVGVQSALTVSEVTCYSNPQWSHLATAGGDRQTSPINRDYTIKGLDRCLATPSLTLSRLIWRTMMSLPAHPNYLQATFRRNQTWGARTADSQLIHLLRSAVWIPQGDKTFVRPADASRDLLPGGFAFDQGWAWLKAIHFGQELEKKSEEHRKRQSVARELGFADEESLERAKRFAALPPADQERILRERERNEGTELPDSEPVNPERRVQRVSADAAEAPERRTEERTRSVSVGRDEVKVQAEQYLSQQYTNTDGEMICQVCKSRVPFSLDDGTPYFERVEFLPELTRRHYQNYLALCPNHAAMFQHANGSSGSLESTFLTLVGNELSVVLAQSETTIYFTKTHIADLQAVIGVDRAEAETELVGGGTGAQP